MGGVHLDGPLWGRPPHARCVEHTSDHVRRQDQHHSRGFHNDPLCGSAVAALGVQGHCRLSRVGDSVDGLLDVHAAARGLIQDPALRHPVAQGGRCGRGFHLGQRSVIGAGLRVLFGARAFAGAVAPFPRGAECGHAARRRRRFRGRASRGGLRHCLQVGVRARVPLWGVPFPVSESQRPDDLVCFVQRRRWGARFAWGHGFRHCCVAVPKSRGRGADVLWLVRWCVGALPVVGVADGRPRGGCFPSLRGASGIRRCPSPGRPSPGAGSRGSATRVSQVRSARAWEPSPAPQCAPLRAGVACCGGGGTMSPGGGAFHHCVRGV